jgi:hypothetical protein
MLFRYSLNIEVDSTFEQPLLGADISGPKRKRVDKFVKDVIKEFIDNGKHTGSIEKTLVDDNLNITVKCGKHLGNANIKR